MSDLCRLTIRWSGPGVRRDFPSKLHCGDARLAVERPNPGRSAQIRWALV